jgi:hypothetical protein
MSNEMLCDIVLLLVAVLLLWILDFILISWFMGAPFAFDRIAMKTRPFGYIRKKEKMSAQRILL